MLTTLLLATLAAAPAGAPEPPHAPEEAALLRAAFPDLDQKSGFLGHSEGYLVDRSSACADGGTCFLAVAATDAVPAVGGTHAWTTFFASRRIGGSWVEVGRTAGPVFSATGRWRVGVSVRLDRNAALVTVSSSVSSPEAGEGTATHLWSWEGSKFMPVLAATTGRQGSTESEATVTLCTDRPLDHPSWELRSRERDAKGRWTEGKVRVLWSGQAWVERAADKPCTVRDVVAAAAAPAPAPTPRVKSASASRTAPPPRGQPQAWAAANAIDGNRQTAWMPGGKKGGVGEWLQLDLTTPAAVGALQLVATCPGGDWKASPRVKRIRIRFEDGPAQEALLADVPAAQTIALRRTEPARWIRVELLELYKGSKKADACLTEALPQVR